MESDDFRSTDPIAWCPGCGNFGILDALRKALVQLELEPNRVLLVSGIGQAAKLPHYVRCNCFNGLHGRALPVAAAAKMANRELTVLVTTGDGDCYGEGGNHFIHNIRRNVDITVLVHNNQIYGLTKGQASPTTDPGFRTKVQSGGVIAEPFHALPLAITMGAGFVARGFSGKGDELAGLIAQAVRHRGFSLVEILQPCISFNRKNTFKWYKERIYDVAGEDGYDPGDRPRAYRTAMEWGERIPTGLLYREEKPTFGDNYGLAQWPPLVAEEHPGRNIEHLVADFRV